VYRNVCVLYRNVYIMHIHTLEVRMFTSGVVIHYVEWGCQSPNPRKYIVLNGNFISDLRDFDLRDVFQERNPSVKREFRSHYLSYLLTVGVEVVYFHLITLRHAPQSVGILWTKDWPLAETSTWQHTNTHKRQTSMHPVGFEPTIPASPRPQTYALDCAAAGIGKTRVTCVY
jgi:hypothetical protein